VTGAPPDGGRTPATLTEVVSVRFSEEELRRVQALAVILETTPNAVIRDACSFYLCHQVGTPAYRQAIEAYQLRAARAVAVLGQDGQAR
jgi:predicted transcriptional regulator